MGWPRWYCLLKYQRRWGQRLRSLLQETHDQSSLRIWSQSSAQMHAMVMGLVSLPQASQGFSTRVAPLIASPGSGGCGPGHVHCHPLCRDGLALFTEEARDRCAQPPVALGLS